MESTSYNYPEIGKVIKMLRIDAEETQAQMADILGVSRSKLSKIERGHEKLDKRLSDKIARLYKKFWSEEEKERFEYASKLSRNIIKAKKKKTKKEKATK